MRNKRKVTELVSPIGKYCTAVDLKKTNEELLETKLSPFASYRGDNHRINRPKRTTSKSEVDFLLEKGHIGEVEKMVLVAINNLVFATSLQITTYLNKKGISIESKSVARKLTRLKEKSFIKQIEFVSENSTSSYKAYYLGYHGIGLLRALDKKTYSQGYVSEIKTAKIKCLLASNQLLTQVMNSDNDFKVSKIILNENIRNCIVRPQSILNCNDKTYLIEAVRQTDGWKEEFLNKLARYENVIEHYDNLNVKFSEKPILIVQGESYDHMIEIMNMVKNKSEGVKIDIIYTYDRILLYNLQEAFFSLDEKQNKKNLFAFLFKN
ncbi:MAG: replication-relaxation family protein [Terrisporobacter sp.]|jgi:DNA-binding Lrp family transcriptional regulator|uniref:replication-relaxation family protein n=1 Tax=Terrisporobacter sp. TaxID=1965305 RepID=UPI0025F70BE1|nr:replication-relaxation family protein [uncultured Terrisporobacter sp.]